MQSAPSNRKFYPAVDVAKFVFAIFVVVLHSFQETSFAFYTPGEASGFFYTLFTDFFGRMPVVFFFIASSFFLFEKVKCKSTEQEKNRVLLGYCKRMLSLYAIWFVINGFWVFYNHFWIFRNSYPVWRMILMLLRDILLDNGFGSSWFIMASILCSIIVFFLSKSKVGKVFAMCLSGLCFFTILLMTWYKFLCPEILQAPFDRINSVFNRFYVSFPFGLTFFVIGKLISDYKEALIDRIQLRTLLILLAVSVCALVFEVYFVPVVFSGKFVYVGTNTYLFTPLFASTLFAICLKFPSYENGGKSQWMRMASSLIYFSHKQILLISILLFSRIGAEKGSTSLLLAALSFTLVLSLLLSWIVLFMSKKQRFGFLRYLY